MKSLDDREEDISALFHSILGRINEARTEADRITFSNKEVHKACIDYAKTYKDYIIWEE